MGRCRHGALLLAVAALAVRAEPVTTAAAPAGDPLATGATTAAAGASPTTPTEPWWSLADSRTLQSLGIDSWGDLFDPGRWHSTLDLTADGNRQTTTAPDTPQSDFWSRLTSEGITFRNHGFALVDPRLLTGDLSVRFARQQGRQNAAEVKSSQGGDVTDYYVGVTLLGEKPYNANLLATQAENVVSQPNGGSTISKDTAQGVTLNWHENTFLREREIMPYFSATLLARQDHLQEVTSAAGQSFRRDERRQRLSLDGHNGFETADLFLRIEDVELDNLLLPAASFSSRYIDLTYNRDIGANLNHKSDTHLNYNERDGAQGVRNLSVDQYFYLEHSDYLSSNYSYNFMQSDSDAGEFMSNRFDGGVQYMPFLNLSTGMNLFGTLENFDTGRIQSEGAYLDVTYDHDLPLGGRLMASLGAGLQFTDSELQSAQVPVVDAPYQAPAEIGAGASFVLEDVYVVTDSIVVVSVRGGARLPAVVGVDYEVVVEGIRTRIVPLASSVVILPNDPLEVSYFRLVDPSLESRTDSRSIFLSADWSWIGLSLTHDETRQTPLAGQQTVLLGDQDRDSLRLEVRGDWEGWNARADGTASRYRDTSLRYDELQFTQQVTYRPGYFWLLGLSASESDTRYTETGRSSAMQDYRFTVSWTSERGWWADGVLTHRALQDSELPSEKLTEGRCRLRRRWPRLDISMSVGMGERTRGGVETSFSDIHLAAVRQFR